MKIIRTVKFCTQATHKVTCLLLLTLTYCLLSLDMQNKPLTFMTLPLPEISG